MSDKICPIIKPDELVKLKDDENLRIFDVSNGPKARANFEARRLAGARFADLNTQLADIKETPADGGRHPLPSAAKFAATLAGLGISPSSRVVLYDDMNGANAAARFWWMLRSIGHKGAQVLDGGLEAAVNAGFPLSDGSETFADGTYDAAEFTLPTADLAQVKRRSEDGNAMIIDVRAAPRFRGETEPFDKVAGHIPNAVNIPFAENLDADGFFLPPEVLREKYEKAFAGRDDVIIHCGSGVTACHTLLALDYAGLEIPKLYVGSWSEWTNNDLPVATGE